MVVDVEEAPVDGNSACREPGMDREMNLSV